VVEEGASKASLKDWARRQPRHQQGGGGASRYGLSVFMIVLLASATQTLAFAPLRSARRGLCCSSMTKQPQVWDRPDYKPIRQGGDGEWEDWLGNEAFIGEDSDYGSDDDAETEVKSSSAPSTMSSSFSEWRKNSGGGGGGNIGDAGDGWDGLLKKGGGGGKSASENWGAGWSEEPPFFDDDDILDEIPDKNPPMTKLGSSDLWSRPDFTSDDTPAPTPTAPAPVASSGGGGGSSLSEDLRASLMLEMKIAALDKEVANLKSGLGLLVGLLIGLQLGDHPTSFF